MAGNIDGICLRYMNISEDLVRESLRFAALPVERLFGKFAFLIEKYGKSECAETTIFEKDLRFILHFAKCLEDTI